MNGSRLVNRNIMAQHGRTSIRLEPELWDALAEICRREGISTGELMRRIEAGKPHAGGRTSAVRVHVLEYFRAAATDEGHAAAGHGPRLARSGGLSRNTTDQNAARPNIAASSA